MSKRISDVCDVIEVLKQYIFSHPMLYIFGLSNAQVEAMLTQAMQQVASQRGVNDSTVYSKCIREIGFDNKYDFFVAVVKQLTKIDDTLLYALHHHKCKCDNDWDILKIFDLPFDYLY